MVNNDVMNINSNVRIMTEELISLIGLNITIALLAFLLITDQLNYCKSVLSTRNSIPSSQSRFLANSSDAKSSFWAHRDAIDITVYGDAVQ
mmetsp:Transcript_10679/g.22209  ORF Transcript_10679/g.22209 Transcript_10679/m.22209 type:complete len:91 (+) Transcript_10679:302-574(+)